MGGGVKELRGRASWRAIAPACPYPTGLGGSLAVLTSAGLEFFHTFRGEGVMGSSLYFLLYRSVPLLCCASVTELLNLHEHIDQPFSLSC